MARSDVFVIYDDVQYDKSGWRNRNRIKTADGAKWLTVPVMVNFREHPLTCEVKIDNKTKWPKKHFQTLRQSYSKAPFFKEFIDAFEEAYSRDWEYLIDLDMFFITRLAEWLGLGDKMIVRSSSLGVKGDRLGRLIQICRTFNVDVFYEGASGRNYIDEELFAAAGIRVVYQEYEHPQYQQLYGEFIPYLSAVDLIFNHGQESLPILVGQKDL